MTDTDDNDGLTDAERIAREIELNPDASANEILGNLSLSPVTWKDTVADALDAEDPTDVLGTGDDPADAAESYPSDSNENRKRGVTDGDRGEEPASATDDTPRVPSENGDDSAHRVSCENDGESAREGEDSDSNPTPDADRGLAEARAVAGLEGSPDDDIEDAEPLGKTDTESVRHTSGAGEVADSDLKDADRDGESAPTDTNKTTCLDTWGHDDTGAWDVVEFDTPKSGVYPPALLEREQWMGRQGKLPFAPWGDRDADLECSHDTCPDHGDDTLEDVVEDCPECQAHRGDKPLTTAECDHDARYKWGHAGHYVDGERVAMAEVDSRLDGRVFLQRDSDPFAFVDGDDVRCPETGDVHPEFVRVLDALGQTYADVSTSGAGVHAYYQGTLPEDCNGQVVFEIDTEPWGANDEPPTVEIYANKHVCVATGEHVPNTPTEVADWDTDALDGLLDAVLDPEDRHDGVGHDTDRERDELEDYEPDATGDETADDVRDIVYAVDRLRARDLPLQSRQVGTDGTGWEKWDPSSYRSSSGHDSLHKPTDEPVFHDHKHGESFGVLSLFAAEQRIISKPWHPLTGSDWWDAVDAARDAGVPIPEFADPENGDGEWYDIETCAPPQVDRQSFEIDARRESLRTDRYDRFVAHHAPTVWGDDPGVGKTTNAAIAAAERDRPHFVAFQGHDKAREFILDEPTPEGYYHLKGAGQKRHDGCMDADHADEDCPDHGHGSNCPHMCPIYDLPSDHPLREEFEALKAELGPVQAHIIIDNDRLDGCGHDDGRCAWLQQFDDIEHEDRIVGVHEYQLLKTVRNPSDGPRRDVIIDEYAGADSVATDRTLRVDPLVRMANVLERIAHRGSDDPVLAEFAGFASDVVDLITSADASTADLEALDPPAVEEHAETVHVEVDRDDLPDWVDPDDVETESVKDYVGMPGEGYRTRQRDYVERVLVDETLAQAKIDYHETLLSQIKSDDRDWNGAPFAFDALIAAAIEAGLPGEPSRRAIAAPTFLDDCPRCGGHFHEQNGERVCDDCDWSESDGFVTSVHDTPARADATIVTNADGQPRALETRKVPLPSELPATPLVLDATPQPDTVAALYGVDRGDVLLEGDDDLAVGDGMHITQVLDGQYHWSTIKQTDTLRERIERTLEKLARVHDDLLVVGRKEAKHVLDVPDGVEWLHYHALRGKNRAEYDAIVCIGAPHADIGDLERNAELLTQNRDDIRVGGAEHSTRRDAPNPPVYRTLEYEDADGQGRAVPTKHYTGLVGDMFRQTREQEIEQTAHRLRPLLTDGETKHAYLLTNVPTTLPIDDVCTFKELADPLQALLPVHERAVTLAEHVRDVTAGDGPDGFRAETLVRSTDDGRAEFHVDELHRLARLNGMDVTERQVRRWKDDLVDIGVLDAGEYKSHEGVPYRADSATLTSALSVLSNNASVEVAVRRRLASLVEESDTALEWLRWARDALALSGDRCGVGPPPGDPSTPG